MTQIPESVHNLTYIGINVSDAYAIRRIAMTLHRWHELECGDSNNYAAWAIVRGTKANGAFEYSDNGKPYIERHLHSENKPRYELVPDRESGAKKRLAKIMGRYPALSTYIQTDPRGTALYIIRPGDIPTGENVDAYYNRGIAVYK